MRQPGEDLGSDSGNTHRAERQSERLVYQSRHWTAGKLLPLTCHLVTMSF